MSEPMTVAEQSIAVDLDNAPIALNVGSVFHAWSDLNEVWEGNATYADLTTALNQAARDYADEEYNYGEVPMPTGALVWRRSHGWWKLHDGDQPTNIIVSSGTLYGAKS